MSVCNCSGSTGRWEAHKRISLGPHELVWQKDNRICLKQSRWIRPIFKVVYRPPHLFHGISISTSHPEHPHKYPSHTYTRPEAKENMIIIRYPCGNYKSQLKRSQRQIAMPLIVSEHSSFALEMLSLFLQGTG